VSTLRFGTRLELIERALLQASEFKNTLGGGDYFPNDFTKNVQRELKLLSVTNAVLGGDQLLFFHQLAITIRDILTWFKNHQNISQSTGAGRENPV